MKSNRKLMKKRARCYLKINFAKGHLFFTVSSFKKVKLDSLKLLLSRNLPPLDVQVEEHKVLASCPNVFVKRLKNNITYI